MRCRKRMKLRDILAQLEYIYCGTIGAEFAHVSDSEERLWLQDQFQAGRITATLHRRRARNILWQLTAAEGLERYLHTKYVGQKRFSLEGGDALIPLLDDLIQRGGSAASRKCVIGMAHRGRLNVLVNLLGKSPSVLFSEFEGKYDTEPPAGLGRREVSQGLLGRPAHARRQRARRARVQSFASRSGESGGRRLGARAPGAPRRRRRATRVLPMLMHGDAAFAGQGVVMETLQLSQARGFYTGGTVHVIINNQVGFTTSDPHDARSTHVLQRRREDARGADLPRERATIRKPWCSSRASRSSTAMRFHKDVVIDLVCYRRHGHNEADEPAATQPVMYQRHPQASDRAASCTPTSWSPRACSPRPMPPRWSSSTARGSTRAARRRAPRSA